MEKEVFEIENYNKFKCIADKCKFTCCEGWDINIDSATYKKWEDSSDKKFFLDNISFVADGEYIASKETGAICPFLDSDKLCSIVKKHGEDYLSSTCKSFPRVSNDFEDRREISLSCACPAVLDIIEESASTKIYNNQGEEKESELVEILLRDGLINILNNMDFEVAQKLVTGYDLLLNILDGDELEYEEFIDLLDESKRTYAIEDRLDEIKGEKVSVHEVLMQVNSIFLDMTENYKNVAGLDKVLAKIFELASSDDVEVISKNYKKFSKEIKKYDDFMLKVLKNKIISRCTNDDIEEMCVALEMIILEYMLLRHGLLLEFSMKNSINMDDVKDYVVVFSRVIGNNIPAVCEYLEEFFESDILDSELLGDLLIL